MSQEPVAFLFAGQGSQYVGMGKDLCETFPESKTVFDKADKVLGFSLSNLCFSGDPEMLKQTINSQPAILTATIAAYEAFKTKSKSNPAFVAGLSLGEYSALVAAGAFTFEDGLRLVRKRSEIMESATHKFPGTMAAVIDLSYDKVKEACLYAGAEIANLNAPGQIVISGKKEAIAKAKELCTAAGAKRVIELEVSGAFHSSLMFEASSELGAFIKNIPLTAADIPVISNFTSKPQINGPEIEQNLVQQMYKSVRWEESMKFILSQGINKFYEFGPGKVLKGLMRRIDSNAQVICIEKKADLEGLA
jgi:[acyl-carrier-protein] S-malonyltransferase